MILLALAKPAAMLGVSSINTQCMAIIFIHSLLSTTYFPEAKLSSTFPSSYSENIQRLFNNNPKIFKDFFACKIVLAANHQRYPGSIQRPSEQQSTAATSSSNQQQQPAAEINSSNQQQQSTAATSSNNQQQQRAAEINSTNQQHQSTAATSSSNQHQRPSTAISIHPTSSTYTIHDDFR